jgi:ABC-2 type transport system permease protein
MLGRLFATRGPMTSIAIGLLFSGLLLPNLLPQIVALAFPWNFARIAVGLTQGLAMPVIWPIAVMASALWTALFIAVALWRFGREEF